MKFDLFGRFKDGEGEDQESGSEDNLSERDVDMRTDLEETVQRMKSQGYSGEDIMQELEGQYPQGEIRKALNVGSDNGNQMTDGPEPMSRFGGEKEMGTDGMSEGNPGQGLEEDNISGNQNPPVENNPAPGHQPRQPPIGASGNQEEEGEISQADEELIEAVVAENMEIVSRTLESLYEDIQGINDRIDGLEDRIEELEVRDDEDQQEFVQKVNEMEDHIDSYSSRIGGLEKAFQQVLPSLVDNVRELTNLVQEMKQEKGIETDASISDKDIQDLDTDEWD